MRLSTNIYLQLLNSTSSTKRQSRVVTIHYHTRGATAKCQHHRVGGVEMRSDGVNRRGIRGMNKCILGSVGIYFAYTYVDKVRVLVVDVGGPADLAHLLELFRALPRQQV